KRLHCRSETSIIRGLGGMVAVRFGRTRRTRFPVVEVPESFDGGRMLRTPLHLVFLSFIQTEYDLRNRIETLDEFDCTILIADNNHCRKTPKFSTPKSKADRKNSVI